MSRGSVCEMKSNFPEKKQPYTNIVLQFHTAFQGSKNCFTLRPGPWGWHPFHWLISLEGHCHRSRYFPKQFRRYELKEKLNDTINKPNRVENKFEDRSLRLNARCVACFFLIYQQKQQPMERFLSAFAWMFWSWVILPLLLHSSESLEAEALKTILETTRLQKNWGDINSQTFWYEPN